jgi:serine/threonine protein phosphatase PrpC
MNASGFSFQVFSGQWVGSRPAQEDSLWWDERRGIFLVADGFGGPGPGTAASKLVCESLKNFLIKEAGDLEATLPFVLRNYFSLAGNVIFNALIHANRNLMTQNQGKSANSKGGASALAGILDGDLLALANVGAGSAWLFRDGEGVELVTPRTYGRLRDPMRLEEAPFASAPMMALGMGADLEPEIVECRLRPGDWILFQSHGVSHALREELLRIQVELREKESASQSDAPTEERSESPGQILARFLGEAHAVQDNASALLLVSEVVSRNL